jgi:hypothetical protein
VLGPFNVGGTTVVDLVGVVEVDFFQKEEGKKKRRVS